MDSSVLNRGDAMRWPGLIVAALLAMFISTSVARAADTPPFKLEGFRSAKFGMSEQDVRGAIQKDFGVRPEAIKSAEHPTEKTQLLSIVAPEPLAKGGKAEVIYTLGFKSRKLIQIGLVWSTALDPTITADTLVGDAALLREHFAGAGYRPDSIVQNAALTNGSFLEFRGSDTEGHTTELVLSGPLKDGANGKKELTPTSLSLRYVMDPTAPDTYKLPAGQF